MSRIPAVAAGVLWLALAGCGASTPPPPFAKQLEDMKSPDTATRREAAKQLAEMGKDDQSGLASELLKARPALSEGMNDQDKATRYWSAIAFVRITASAHIPAPIREAVPHLEEAAKDDAEKDAQAAAADLLKRMRSGPRGGGPGPGRGPGPAGEGKETPADADKEKPAKQPPAAPGKPQEKKDQS